MKEHAMITKGLTSQIQFPSAEHMMFGAVFGTIVGLLVGLWLKSYVDRKTIEENRRMKKLPNMTWYKKSGPLTVIWRMLGV